MYNDELYHYGIKGMRWGVRRSRNYNTPAGKRYQSAKANKSKAKQTYNREFNSATVWSNRHPVSKHFGKNKQIEKQKWDAVNNKYHKDYKDASKKYKDAKKDFKTETTEARKARNIANAKKAKKALKGALLKTEDSFITADVTYTAKRMKEIANSRGFLDWDDAIDSVANTKISEYRSQIYDDNRFKL